MAGEARGRCQTQGGLGPEWPGLTVRLLPGPTGTVQGLAFWFPVPSFVSLLPFATYASPDQVVAKSVSRVASRLSLIWDSASFLG